MFARIADPPAGAATLRQGMILPGTGNPQPATAIIVDVPGLDHHRLFAFLRFTARRFVDDRCLLSAGALAYTSLFALVPLTAVVLGVFSRFPAFAHWRDRITDFVFTNFVPAAGDVVQRYLTEFADNASKATAVGVIVLVLSALMLMLSVESTFNRIWRVTAPRPARTRFVVYWAVITLLPMLLAAALALSSYLFALPLLHAADWQFSVRTRLLGLLPFLIEWVTLGTAYVLIPNRSVRLRDAALGALVAALLFELAKRAFAAYVTTGANYEQIYGALAIVPVFILWIYLSWVLVLLGASLSAIIAAFDYRPAAARLAPGEEFFALLRVLAHFAVVQRRGSGLHSAVLRDSEPMLDDDVVQRCLSVLERIGMIQRNEAGEWLLTRNLAALSLYDVYAASGFRLPLGDPLPEMEVDADAGAVALVRHTSTALRERLRVPLSEIFPASAGSECTDSLHDSKETVA